LTAGGRAARWRVIGPGLLLAATGVGAGDLATASFTGSQLGVAVLWAVVLGAGLKFSLTEGLARWQLATGQTLLEGALLLLGRPARWLFLLYLLPWTWFVGSALVSACGVTAHALLPLSGDAAADKVPYGIACSLAGLLLVEVGGYALFEKLMRLCIGLMFVTALWTAGQLLPDAGSLLRGMFVPAIPSDSGEGLSWTIALIGGVGGSLTVLCYGYWMQEEGRTSAADLSLCRVDLAVGYAATACFGMAMVVIGSGVRVDGHGAGLIVALADHLEDAIGPAARVTFLAGAFGAVFSSLLGVWQSVPYVFADFFGIVRHGGGRRVATKSAPYRVYLWAMALLPLLGLQFQFREVQKSYAVVGALFLPLLALTLLLLNGRRQWVGAMRNRPVTVLVLLAAMSFFVVAGVMEVAQRLG